MTNNLHCLISKIPFYLKKLYVYGYVRLRLRTYIYIYLMFAWISHLQHRYQFILFIALVAPEGVTIPSYRNNSDCQILDGL